MITYLCKWGPPGRAKPRPQTLSLAHRIASQAQETGKAPQCPSATAGRQRSRLVFRSGISACSDGASTIRARTTALAGNSGPPVRGRCERSRTSVPNGILSRSRLVDRTRSQFQFHWFPASMRCGRRRPHDSSTGSGTVRNVKRRESPSRVQVRLIPFPRFRTAVRRPRIAFPRRHVHAEAVCLSGARKRGKAASGRDPAEDGRLEMKL